MRKIINFCKRFIPAQAWQFVRTFCYRIYDFVRSIGPRVKKIRYQGLDLYYNRGNNIILRLKKEPVFEEEMCVKIASYLSGPGHHEIIDIGANIGLISSYVLSHVSDIKIHAFEPGPVQREMLATTLSKNKLEHKITLYPDAVSNKEGEAVFYSHDPKYVAGDGFIDTGRAHKARAISVHMTTLDAWWESVSKPRVDLVKIDTEGAELWILEGAKNFIKEAQPIIFLEIEPLNLRAYPHTHLDILSWFENANYNLFTMKDVQITRENFDHYLKTEDTYIARPAISTP